MLLIHLTYTFVQFGCFITWVNCFFNSVSFISICIDIDILDVWKWDNLCFSLCYYLKHLNILGSADYCLLFKLYNSSCCLLAGLICWLNYTIITHSLNYYSSNSLYIENAKSSVKRRERSTKDRIAIKSNFWRGVPYLV